MNPQMSFPAAWTSYSLAALCLRFWVVLSPSFCLSLPISHTLCFSSSSLRPTQPCFHPHYVLWLYPLLHRPQPFLVLVVSIAGLVTLGSFPLLFFWGRAHPHPIILASPWATLFPSGPSNFLLLCSYSPWLSALVLASPLFVCCLQASVPHWEGNRQGG